MYLRHEFQMLRLPGPRGRSADRPTRIARSGVLTKLERLAVGIGVRDAARCGWRALARSTPARLDVGAWLLRTLGVEAIRPLANERLELLRLYAAMVVRADARADAVALELEGCGMGLAALCEATLLAAPGR